MDMESSQKEQKTNKYNKTQLNPDTCFERHVYHRDQFAHYLRWTHVLKLAKIGQNILDWGCGSGNLLEVFYRNRYKGNQYLGVDVRKATILKNQQKFENVDWAKFIHCDLCAPNMPKLNNIDWDIIGCFEVIEHIHKKNAPVFLDNIKQQMSDNTVLLLSTPIYDPSVGAASNHIIDGDIGEFYYDELKNLLNERFKIIKTYGTFASKRDYRPLMNDWQKKFYDEVNEYFDSNILSTLMAPMFPEHSRNCLWKLTRKD